MGDIIKVQLCQTRVRVHTKENMILRNTKAIGDPFFTFCSFPALLYKRPHSKIKNDLISIKGKFSRVRKTSFIRENTQKGNAGIPV